MSQKYLPINSSLLKKGKFISYSKKVEEGLFQKRIFWHRGPEGLKGPKPKTLYVCHDKNRFDAEWSVVPKEYNSRKVLSPEYVKDFMYDPKFRYATKKPNWHKEYLQKQDSYLIHDNGGRPFLVYISRDGTVTVYRYPENIGYDDVINPNEKYGSEKSKKYYTQRLLRYKKL
jgi:hypothetical protein